MKTIIGILIVLILCIFYLKNRNFKKTITYKWKIENDKLKASFIQILSNNPSLEYLIIEFKPYYIQYKGFRKSNEFYSEIIGNKFLNDSNKYSLVQKNKILNLNFLEPFKQDNEGNISPNFSKWYNANSKTEIEQIFIELITILESVYNIEKGTKIRIRY